MKFTRPGTPTSTAFDAVATWVLPPSRAPGSSRNSRARSPGCGAELCASSDVAVIGAAARAAGLAVKANATASTRRAADPAGARFSLFNRNCSLIVTPGVGSLSSPTAAQPVRRGVLGLGHSAGRGRRGRWGRWRRPARTRVARSAAGHGNGDAHGARAPGAQLLEADGPRPAAGRGGDPQVPQRGDDAAATGAAPVGDGDAARPRGAPTPVRAARAGARPSRDARSAASA